jgi:hypothetical protein
VTRWLVDIPAADAVECEMAFQAIAHARENARRAALDPPLPPLPSMYPHDIDDPRLPEPITITSVGVSVANSGDPAQFAYPWDDHWLTTIGDADAIVAMNQTGISGLGGRMNSRVAQTIGELPAKYKVEPMTAVATPILRRGSR